MTGLAVAAEPGFALSRIDAPDPAGKPNYTLHTLERLQEEIPHAALFCLMGADSYFSLRQWHGSARIPFVASLIVASRPGQSLDDLARSLPEGLALDAACRPAESADPAIELRSCTLRNAAGRTAAFYVLPGLDVEISASEIRARLGSEPRDAGAVDPALELVPAAVARYIREHGLYQSPIHTLPSLPAKG